MIKFNPSDPFPLLSEGAYSYQDAQVHSEIVDSWLGLNTKAVEDAILKTSQTKPASESESEQKWVGLPTQSLLTPYSEIRTLLSYLNPQPGTCIVDLGAAYGRMGFVIGAHYPKVSFVGYELVEARVSEANRCLAQHQFLDLNIRVELADLAATAFKPVLADFFFLYDFGNRTSIEKSLEDLRSIARLRPIQVVGRGRASRDAIERQHPWLSQVVEPLHRAHYSIYRSSYRSSGH